MNHGVPPIPYGILCAVFDYWNICHISAQVMLPLKTVSKVPTFIRAYVTNYDIFRFSYIEIQKSPKCTTACKSIQSTFDCALTKG